MSLHRITLTVILAFALALTLSCGDHSWEDWFNVGSSSSEEDAEGDSSSSRGSGGGNSSSGRSSSSGGNSVIAGGSCDIKDYRTVEIGSQIWMAENYNCKVSGSYCYGENGVINDYPISNYPKLSDAQVQANCKKYGRLYSWAVAMALPEGCCDEDTCSCYEQIEDPHQGVCPSGWHIPSKDDWLALEKAAGGNKTAGKNLKAKDGWEDCGPSGSGKKYLCEDIFDFSALPGGSGLDWNSPPFFGMTFHENIGETGEWWSVDYKSFGVWNNNEKIIFGPTTPPDFFLYLSVRCLKDKEE
jgi:uncharacterized protein (TIGR02145 family)